MSRARQIIPYKAKVVEPIALLPYEERVRLDMYYIRNYSIWLDLQILFIQTIPAVIKGHGAY